MEASQEIEQLKQNILTVQGIERQKSVEKLIELEGMKSMDFFQSIFLKDPFHKEEATFELHGAAGYGVRQLMELRAKESKSDFRFCPYCDLGLSDYKILDSFMIGLKCNSDHYFHIEVQHGECKDKQLKVDKGNSIDIAKEWLTNKIFRTQIQNPVAEILRKYIDVHHANKMQDEQNHTNSFCPVCGLILQEFKQDDVWVQGLKCSNGHILYSRYGLSYKNAELKPDINKSTFHSLVKNNLEEQQSQYLPNQIVQILQVMNKIK